MFRTVSSTISQTASSAANAYVYLCSQGDQGGVIGIAWLRGTCNPNRYTRSSINEYLVNDVITASVSPFITVNSSFILISD